MSRFVRSLAGAIALASAIAQSLAAQHDTHQSIPAIGALRAGVPSAGSGQLPDGSDSTTSSSSTAQRASIQDEATIEARRSRFTAAGVVIGLAGATLWTVKANRRDDGKGGIFLALVLPLTAVVGGVIGGGLGQFVSLFILPEPNRDWTRY